MNMRSIIAILLIGFGVVVLAYSGITFSTPGEPVNFLGLHFQTTVNHFIPPVVGAVVLVGGLMLFLTNRKPA